MTTDDVATHVELQQLAYRYAFAVDSRDVDALADMHWPLDDTDPAAYQAAVRERLDTNLAKVGVSFLNVGTHLIDEIGTERAKGYVYCKAEFEQDGRWCEQAILYRDDYIKANGRWHFGYRDHQLWYGAPRSVDPLTLPPANWPENQLGSGTIPFSLDSWKQFWAGHERR